MSSEPTGRFVEALPPDVTGGGRLPLSWAVLTSAAADAATDQPTVACDHHRTVGYVCLPYHKPISRCLGAGR